mgnify:CR=1 FL=1
MKNLTPTNAFMHLTIISVLLFNSCGSTAPIISTPIENIDKTPSKFSPLTAVEEKIWSHLDLQKDTVPGVSLNLAYEKLVKPFIVCTPRNCNKCFCGCFSAGKCPKAT